MKREKKILLFLLLFIGIFSLSIFGNLFFFFNPVSTYLLPEGFFKEDHLDKDRLEPKDFSVSFKNLETVIFYCDETGVPVWLACRLFSVESSRSGNPLDPAWVRTARSSVDALGLGQVLRSNEKEFSLLYNEGKKIDFFDEKTSIKISLRYLSELYELTDSWLYALASYNGGLAHFLNPKKFGKFKEESLAYARKILG